MNDTELEAELKNNFLFFLFMIWKHLGLPNPTPLQNDIALALANAPARYIVEAFRGCGKSFITAAYVLWRLYRDPQIKVMVVSANKERADAFSQFVMRLIKEVDFLAHLKPDKTKKQRDTLLSFDVGPAITDQSPSVKSVGITGQLTGSRANLIIADDIEVPGNSFTQDARDKLATLVQEFDAVIKPYDERTMAERPQIIYLGTPQTEMSLYNVLYERGYDTHIWPVLFPNDKEKTYYGSKLAPYIANHPDYVDGMTTEPDRFDMEDIENRRRSYGAAGFALQFMLNTALSDADRFPLRTGDMICMSIDMNKAPVDLTYMKADQTIIKELPSVGLSGDRWYGPAWVSDEYQPWQRKVLAVDPSGRGKDETTWCVIYIYNSYVYLKAMHGSRKGYEDEVLEAIAMTAKLHKVTDVVIEDNFGDGMFTKLLQPYLNKHWPCVPEEVKQTTQKEPRMIDVLEPVVSQHRLVVDRQLIEMDLAQCEKDKNYSLFQQMTRLTKEKGCLAQDDRVDVLHIAVKHVIDMMDLDAKVEEQERQEQLMEDFLKKYVVGYEGSTGDTMFDSW